MILLLINIKNKKSKYILIILQYYGSIPNNANIIINLYYAMN